MAVQSKCIVSGCGKKIHAKGFCRKHYEEYWESGRMGMMLGVGLEPAEEADEHGESDRVRALERELRRAEMMYHNVIGLEGRLKWRREIKEVKQEMKRLGVEPQEMRPRVMTGEEVGAAG